MYFALSRSFESSMDSSSFWHVVGNSWFLYLAISHPPTSLDLFTFLSLSRPLDDIRRRPVAFLSTDANHATSPSMNATVRGVGKVALNEISLRSC